MELKVFKSTITAYGGRWETRLELPVETEILIPDYLPAVFKIVKCLIEPVVMQNNIAASRWQGEGYLRCTVYYQSDEAGTRLYRTEQKFSFEKAVELPAGQYVEGPARLWGELEYCNCRAISEHRIDLRGAYALCVSANAVAEYELLNSLADCGIEQRTVTMEGVVPVAAEEKTFTAEGNIGLPGAGETILDIGGTASLQVTSVQTGQVNCEGSLRIQACYLPVSSEEIAVCQKELPLRQTVELPGVAEGDLCCCWGEVLGCTLTAAEGEELEPVLNVTWKLHIEAWRAGQYMAVADAYSTVCQTALTRMSYKLLQKRSDLSATVNAVVEDALPDPDVEVKGCFVTLGALLPVQEKGENGDQVCLTGKATAHLLCSDARGELTCYDKAFSWQLPDRWQGEAAQFLPHLHAAVARVTSGKSGEKMRVEVEISVSGILLQAVETTAVEEVELGEMFPDKNQGPALYLYYAAQGERIFDIAKHYHARAKDLAAANHLEPENGGSLQEMTTGAACLLIPAAL